MDRGDKTKSCSNLNISINTLYTGLSFSFTVFKLKCHERGSLLVLYSVYQYINTNCQIYIYDDHFITNVWFNRRGSPKLKFNFFKNHFCLKKILRFSRFLSSKIFTYIFTCNIFLKHRHRKNQISENPVTQTAGCTGEVLDWHF